MQRPRSNFLFLACFGFSVGLSIGFSPMAFSYENQITPMAPGEKIQGAEKMSIQEKLGTELDLNLPLKNEQGQIVKLGSFFSGHKPVVMSLVYFNCPGLCNFHLNGLIEGLKQVDWTPGDKFELLAISFDPKEGPEVGNPKKQNYMELYGRPEAVKGVHFLTADEKTIAALTQKVGFNYKWDESSKQWAHSSAAIMVSPKGTVTRYLHGIIFDPKDLRLALTEASNGKIGTFVDQMIWYCYMYDPHLSKFTFYAFRLVQLGGVVVILFLMVLVLPHLWRWREPRRSH